MFVSNHIINYEHWNPSLDAIYWIRISSLDIYLESSVLKIHLYAKIVLKMREISREKVNLNKIFNLKLLKAKLRQEKAMLLINYLSSTDFLPTTFIVIMNISQALNNIKPLKRKGSGFKFLKLFISWNSFWIDNHK